MNTTTKTETGDTTKGRDGKGAGKGDHPETHVIKPKLRVKPWVYGRGETSDD